MTPPRGLYLLVDDSILAPSCWPEVLPSVLAAGPALAQYRSKNADAKQREASARALLGWCRAAGVPLLINDDPTLASAIGADGVHLGRDDEAVAAARRRLGPSALIGASCYADLELAAAAIAAGADYVSFGRLFASRTKPDAPGAPLALLTQAQQRWPGRVCAIGGIDATNAARVRAAGADLCCVGHGVLGQDDPAANARKIATICDRLSATNP